MTDPERAALQQRRMQLLQEADRHAQAALKLTGAAEFIEVLLGEDAQPPAQNVLPFDAPSPAEA